MKFTKDRSRIRGGRRLELQLKHMWRRTLTKMLMGPGWYFFYGSPVEKCVLDEIRDLPRFTATLEDYRCRQHGDFNVMLHPTTEERSPSQIASDQMTGFMMWLRNGQVIQRLNRRTRNLFELIVVEPELMADGSKACARAFVWDKGEDELAELDEYEW
jgi:hypothetical protein